MRPSCRAEAVKSFLVMDVLERAHALEAKGHHVVHLEIGEPDFDTPEPVKRAAARALAAGQTHYTHSLGLPELRRAVSEHYRAAYGVGVDPARIIVTSGTSPAMLLAFAAIIDPGQEVMLSDPSYACYPNFVEFVNGTAVRVPVKSEDGFQLDPVEIRRRATADTRAVILNSPSNPTGNLLSDERMAALANLGLHLVSDEIYHGLVYEGRERSILEFTDEAFVLNGFSKLYAMTGWRLGYLIAPERYMDCIRRMAQNLFICAGSVAQWAGVAALTETAEHVAHMRAVYDERRRFLVARLRELGFGLEVEPTGAFYVLVDARHLSSDSLALAFEILEKAHVGVTPGIDFGPGAEGFLRFSYANSLENIREGMDRLERFLDQRG